MGTIARVLGIAVMAAGAALGTASPSSADQVMEGIYTFNAEGSPSASGRSTRYACPPWATCACRWSCRWHAR